MHMDHMFMKLMDAYCVDYNEKYIWGSSCSLKGCKKIFFVLFFLSNAFTKRKEICISKTAIFCQTFLDEIALVLSPKRCSKLYTNIWQVLLMHMDHMFTKLMDAYCVDYNEKYIWDSSCSPSGCDIFGES